MRRDASDLVRKCFSAWETKDKETLEELLAEDFTFTSPNDDDHISKDEYWKKCWPGSEKIRAIRVDKLFEKGDEAFVRYECELKDGARFRNTEYFRIEGNKIKEVEVYFGSSIKAAASGASSTVIAPTRKSSLG
jgi:ketosteroid isomerase-like protein